MPTTISFHKLFGKSPFPPMHEHMRLAVQCAEEIPALIEAMLVRDDGQLKELKYRIFELEDQADKVYDELTTKLPKSMFMPVHRHDLLSVLESQEAIADTAQDITGLAQLPLEIPAEMHKPLVALAKRSAKTCKRALKVIESISELVETGFKGPDVDRVHGLIDDVAKSEQDADNIGIDLTTAVFLHHKDTDPVSVVFTYQLVRWLGDLSDHAEIVGAKTRLLIAK